MARNRVLSFVSQFSSRGPATPASSPPATSPTSPDFKKASPSEPFPDHQLGANPPPTPPPYQEGHGQALNNTAQNSPHQRQRSTSRPLSYQPPLMDITEDTIPELQPVFTFLNSHSNKLYQEGYFLKLDDQNTQGRPNQDRTWTECFAQLVGTVLSLWDAAELDAAGEDGEVLPKFINLTDASIKMIESLPTRSKEEQPLQNILSISTAGRNRYLLHFNSHHSLVQWTAGIRLSMFEHATLQEAYTGALIAGKGKTLNNINVIMERARLEVGEWVRVRFGAGVPWRRCWCVITPPDEKEYAKQQKELKKRSAYDRSAAPVLKGDIKFYDTKKEGKKQKKLQPIASITDAYAAYAIYPQAKSLVDASTLVKIEGNVAIHTEPPSATEGFVFVMPEVHPMVSGFEMLMRYLFPTWDTFGLYGRPGRLVASTLDQRSLMFAMPKHKRYGYLEILDVTTLINEKGSSAWTEKDWRRRLKEATGTRMNAVEAGVASHVRSASRNSQTFASGRPKVGFADDRGSTRSSRSFSLNGGPRTDSAPPDAHGNWPQPNMAGAQAHHTRNSSDPNLGGQRPGYGHDARPPFQGGGQPGPNAGLDQGPPNMGAMRSLNTPEPVSRPPAFNHGPQDRSVNKAYHSPELRRANSRLSSTTLAQMATAGGLHGSKGAELDGQPFPPNRENAGAPVHSNAAPVGGPYANPDASRQALNVPSNRPGNQPPPPLNFSNDQRSRSPYGPPSPAMQGPNSPRPQTAEGRRSPYPPGGPPGGPQGRGQPGPPGQRPPPGGENYRPGPNGPPGPPGPHGRPGPGPGPGPGQRPDGHPHRKPIPMRGGPPGPPGGPGRGPPPTADDIIDAYSSDARQPPRGPPGPPPPPHGGANYGGERPRAGVLKTVAGGEPAMQPNSGFDIPDVNFGPTVNYGASGRRPGPSPGGSPGPGGPPGQQGRPYTPDMRPPNAGRGPPPASPYYGDEPKTMAWQPGAAAAGSPGPGLSPEQYVQHRAAAASPQFGDGRSPSPGYGGGGQPAGSFSRPMRSPQANEYPQQGQYGPGQGRSGNPPQQYQGQAF